MPMVPRSEHPRPDFMRDTFLNLNGEWQFAFDDANLGIDQGWQKPGVQLPLKITVPFAYQTKLSGIGPMDEIHPVIWYRRSFCIPQEMAGKRILLRFVAVDYKCSVYVNGQMVGGHEGGYTPFDFDITHALQDGENDLCLRVEDDPDCTQPRGKQYWDRGLMGCWYTPVSGIWQTVYLEAAGEYALKQIHIVPDVDRHMFTAEIALDKQPREEMLLELNVSYGEKSWKKVIISLNDRQARVPVDMIVKGDLDPVKLWSPATPHLYDLEVKLLRGDEIVDVVKTYFGMRKIENRNGRIYLNNCPYYQRLVLDQGYWPDSLITPPSDEAIKKDIKWTLKLGYNGARKHQKLEDPRYYYWADKLGLLVWGEIPSTYDFAADAVCNLGKTMMDFIDRDYNHPCIVVWVPLNESWGMRNMYADPRQQATGRMLYHLCKSLDQTRLVSSNDGWEQMETDICALHDYAADGSVIASHFASRAAVESQAADWRACYAQGNTATGKEAFMITEYGGIAYELKDDKVSFDAMENWGYHGTETDEEAFFARLKSINDAVRAIPYCEGYCYTQLTDVMQEINGVLTADRRPKVNVERFAALNQNPFDRTNQVNSLVTEKWEAVD